jgi:hypothetical protein
MIALAGGVTGRIEKRRKKSLAILWSREKITKQDHAGRGLKANGKCQFQSLLKPWPRFFRDRLQLAGSNSED